MPTAASLVRTIKVSETSPDDNPYVLLVQAVIARAVADARGETSPARHLAPAVLIAEARAWLAEETEVIRLLELAGFDAGPLVSRIRRVLREPVPPIADPQLRLL